ncbi:hypothetical protein tb265_15250 [Gemmatimonadetes bacterium T265]|nr:hypothetical protein tb265_15250 [Gemmatimonadetes bacterium T265]
MNGFTLLAPWGLALGAAVAGVLVLLHAITVGRPRPAWLPTARFAPDRAPRAARRIARSTDRGLLALRVAAVLLAGLALARPVREPVRRRVARLVLADVSDGATGAAVRDSVRALVGAGDALVAFAAVPRPVLLLPINAPAADAGARRAALDSALAAAGQDADAPASLSAALVAARRAALALAAGADSLELVVVSPFGREVVDAGTRGIRATWAGRARIVRVAAAVPMPRAAPDRRLVVALREGPADDALGAALGRAGIARDDAAPVRLVRSAAVVADRDWAAALPGRVLVIWPAGGAQVHVGSAGPVAEGFLVSGRAVVGAYGRLPLDAAGDQRRASRTVARWADGTPAAVEQRTGNDGCVRTVGVRVPQTGDAALRPGFVAVLPALLGACGTTRDRAPLTAADLASLAGTGPLLAAAPLRAPHAAHAPDPLGAALLAVSAALLLLELPLRRFWRRTDDAGERDVTNAATDSVAVGTPAPARAEAA